MFLAQKMETKRVERGLSIDVSNGGLLKLKRRKFGIYRKVEKCGITRLTQHAVFRYQATLRYMPGKLSSIVLCKVASDHLNSSEYF